MKSRRLILARRRDEAIILEVGDTKIRIKPTRHDRGITHLCIEAPAHVKIAREEIWKETPCPT